MTLRELIERIEQESLHPTMMDLPLTLIRHKAHLPTFQQDREFHVTDIRVDSANGVVLTIEPEKKRGPWR